MRDWDVRVDWGSEFWDQLQSLVKRLCVVRMSNVNVRYMWWHYTGMGSHSLVHCGNDRQGPYQVFEGKVSSGGGPKGQGSALVPGYPSFQAWLPWQLLGHSRVGARTHLCEDCGCPDCDLLLSVREVCTMMWWEMCGLPIASRFRVGTITQRGNMDPYWVSGCDN